MHANLIDVFSFLSLHYQDQELWNAVDFRRCYYFGGRWVMVRGLIDRPWLLSQEFLRPCFQRDFFYRKMANSPPYQLCSFSFGLLLDVCSHCYSWRVVYSCTNYSRTIHLYDQVPSSVGKIHIPDHFEWLILYWRSAVGMLLFPCLKMEKKKRKNWTSLIHLGVLDSVHFMM